MVSILKICDVDRNKTFVKNALESTSIGLLVTILDDSSGITESFKDSIIQVKSAPRWLAIIATAIAKDTVALAPIARYAAKIVKKKMAELVKDLVLTLPSPPPSGLDSFSDEACKSRKDRRSKMKLSRRKSLVLSLHKRKWSLKRSVKHATKSYKWSMASSDARDRARDI